MRVWRWTDDNPLSCPIMAFYTDIYTYIYLYICVCVYICICVTRPRLTNISKDELYGQNLSDAIVICIILLKAKLSLYFYTNLTELLRWKYDHLFAKCPDADYAGNHKVTQCWTKWHISALSSLAVSVMHRSNVVRTTKQGTFCGAIADPQHSVSYHYEKAFATIPNQTKWNVFVMGSKQDDISRQSRSQTPREQILLMKTYLELVHGTILTLGSSLCALGCAQKLF